ncbi:AAA-ATPase-like domain-containing protein [Endogone sp. FLAS-F59071]|nr:AAA-ATPase-like domain-containing protein [Endogone sp. FLAS-F59071]|eukprot:RUS21686.1 AAA-ATPase-like domain-containing protein [Endogone sp. FLAS-F59071]
MYISKGVSPLAMNDVTSGFNIRYDITLIPRYEHMCGFEEDVRHALMYVCAGKEELTDEEKQKFVDDHLEQMRKYYNGYKFRATTEDGVFNTNLCLDYLQRMSMDDPLQLSTPITS